MKTDFRVLLFIFLIATAACGKQRTSSDAFQKAADECLSDVLPKRYVVKNFDGSIKMVEAESTQEFLDGYLTENLEQVEYAEQDFQVRLQDVVSAQENTTGYANNWGVQQVKADSLWKQNVRGAGITVAIIDTGMDVNHLQLRKQISTNAGEMGVDAQGRDKSSNGVDDDGNGFVDDSGGYDFVANTPLVRDYTGHGTHVAGVIAAAHNDTSAAAGTYVQGIAPSAKILPLAFLNAQGSGSMLNGVRAIQYAVKRGAKVINASWGGPRCSRTLKETIAGLEAQGVIFVSAAGNDGANIDRYPMYPASLEYASQIVVGATGDHDLMDTYSNYGPVHVHLFAPGSNIVSTYPDNKMAALTGTSMATPFVTGAIALLLSADPAANVAKIRQVLYSSSAKSPDYLNASQGRMDLGGALAFLRQ